MSRVSFVLQAMAEELERQINEEIERRLDEGSFSVHGLSVAQVKALATKFRRDTGLDPVKCSVVDIIHDGRE